MIRTAAGNIRVMFIIRCFYNINGAYLEIYIRIHFSVIIAFAYIYHVGIFYKLSKLK